MKYEDLLALPEHLVGEIIDDELHVSPRPRLGHANAAGVLLQEIGPPFRRGIGGPGGWIILPEPEVHLLTDVVVPDLAGWRRERVPAFGDEAPYATIAPDWVCEVISPSTAKLDRGKKLAVYARERVTYVWFVDPAPRTLEVLRLDGETHRVVLRAEHDAVIHAEPFDAIELTLGALWTW